MKLGQACSRDFTRISIRILLIFATRFLSGLWWCIFHIRISCIFNETFLYNQTRSYCPSTCKCQKITEIEKISTTETAIGGNKLYLKSDNPSEMLLLWLFGVAKLHSEFKFGAAVKTYCEFETSIHVPT